MVVAAAATSARETKRRQPNESVAAFLFCCYQSGAFDALRAQHIYDLGNTWTKHDHIIHDHTDNDNRHTDCTARPTSRTFCLVMVGRGSQRGGGIGRILRQSLRVDDESLENHPHTHAHAHTHTGHAQPMATIVELEHSKSTGFPCSKERCTRQNNGNIPRQEMADEEGGEAGRRGRVQDRGVAEVCSRRRGRGWHVPKRGKKLPNSSNSWCQTLQIGDP